MSKVSPARRQHRSMRGKLVDMDLLRKRNELTPAVGNARVNARGDELGPGGKILRKREEVVKEHYAQAGKARSDSGVVKPAAEEELAAIPEAKTETNKLSAAKKPVKKSSPKVEEQFTAAEKALLEQETEEERWIEDTDGNFTKKGK